MRHPSSVERIYEHFSKEEASFGRVARDPRHGVSTVGPEPNQPGQSVGAAGGR